MIFTSKIIGYTNPIMATYHANIGLIYGVRYANSNNKTEIVPMLTKRIYKNFRIKF